MLSVTVYSIKGRDQVVDGTISWNGSAFSISSDGLRWILREPILVSGASGLRKVYAKDAPEEFMRNLWKHYKSAYFNASKAVEI
jgi:hypothetical protein